MFTNRKTEFKERSPILPAHIPYTHTFTHMNMNMQTYVHSHRYAYTYICVCIHVNIYIHTQKKYRKEANPLWEHISIPGIPLS